MSRVNAYLVCLALLSCGGTTLNVLKEASYYERGRYMHMRGKEQGSRVNMTPAIDESKHTSVLRSILCVVFLSGSSGSIGPREG